MTQQSTAEELKAILTPFKQKHLTPQEEVSLEEASVKEWTSDVAKRSMRQLVEEAKALMTSGDATTAAAKPELQLDCADATPGNRLKRSRPTNLDSGRSTLSTGG